MPGAGGIRAEQACATAAWSGPQTRSRIEALLCDARITRVLLCPRGQVTGFQPLRDCVTPAQRRNLAARDLHCVVRGCTRPPAMCDAHHLRRRADGGETTMDNLVLLRLSHECSCSGRRRRGRRCRWAAPRTARWGSVVPPFRFR